jgi:septum site-determining protein MinC
VSNVAGSQGLTRFRGRSYLAFALAPEPPIVDWLSELDKTIAGAAGFFAGRPVVLDLSSVKLSKPAIAHLVSELRARDLQIMGIEGTDPADLGPDLPPLLKGGRPTADVSPADSAAPDLVPAARPRQPEASSLVLEAPVRSGQSVVHPDGDVIVLGSVASGAEIMAGGSIHIYGALRGQAFAGAGGNRKARIFCSRLEAELMAVDGFYLTAEMLGTALHGRSVQAWLDGNMLMVAPLD